VRLLDVDIVHLEHALRSIAVHNPDPRYQDFVAMLLSRLPDELRRLRVREARLLERVRAIADIPCATNRGLRVRCMPGDHCSFCRCRELLAELDEKERA